MISSVIDGWEMYAYRGGERQQSPFAVMKLDALTFVIGQMAIRQWRLTGSDSVISVAISGFLYSDPASLN